jgi:ATP-binding cassette subfamily F protein uup
MNYLSAEEITKSFSDNKLLDKLTLGISRGQKVALVGMNGSGKSTLLNILAGKEQPDSGKVVIRKGVSTGFLGQNPYIDPELSVLQSLFDSDSEVNQVVRDYEHYLTDETPEGQQKLQEAMTKMDDLKAWDYENKVHQILSKLGIDNLEQKVGSLSGGQRKRVSLARLLIEEPELLIMDEPTNHLDLDTIEWLEELLTTNNQTLLLVTHDRYFLDRVVNEIVELENGKTFTYKGNYSYFLEKKAEREFNQDQEVEKARNLMRKELEWMRRMPKARSTKSKSRIEDFYELKDKASQMRIKPKMELTMKASRQGGKIVELHNISKSFGDLKLVEKFTHHFQHGERAGIVGKNGVGKSTFLNMLTGRLEPDTGKISTGETTVFGYYTQEGLHIKEDQRVIDVIKEIAEVVVMDNGSKVTASQFLTFFQFPPAKQYDMVAKLSGGEKRRLHLMQVLIRKPNFLILDEPTNDLDLFTLNLLEEFLLGYNGCLLIVSHDRYFLDKLATHLFIFEGEGKIRDFNGNYTEYRLDEEEKRLFEKTAKEAPKPVPKIEATASPADKKKKLSYKELQEFQGLETEIAALEEKKEILIEKLSSGEGSVAEITDWSKQIQKISDELEEKGMRWLELSEIA